MCRPELIRPIPISDSVKALVLNETLATSTRQMSGFAMVYFFLISVRMLFSSICLGLINLVVDSTDRS